MDENTLNDVPYDLIISYLEGSISVKDKVKLHTWKSSSDSNEEIYCRISAVYKDIELLSVYRKLDSEISWDHFKPLIEGKSENANRIVPVSENKIIKVRTLKWAIVIAASVLLAVFYAVFNDYNTNIVKIFTGIHQHKKITLPDGSEILLNEKTSIDYNTKTFDQNRTINFLNGEALFNIKHNDKKPFKIKVSEIEIKDIGTSFDVRKEKKKVFVIVSSGMVSLSNKLSGEKAVLIKNQKGTCDLASKTIISTGNDEVNYTAWADHDFQFIQTPLTDIVKKLEEVYGTTILLDDEKLKNKKLTISFHNESVDSVLSIISQTIQIKIEKKDNTFHLKGKSF